MGGRSGVQSQPGQGSLFAFVITAPPSYETGISVDAEAQAESVVQAEDGTIRTFDLEATIRRFGGSQARVERVLFGFMRDFANGPQQLDAYLRVGDRDAIDVLTHAIKGMVGYLGAEGVESAANAVNYVIRGRDVPAIESAVKRLKEQLEALLPDIERALETLRSS